MRKSTAAAGIAAVVAMLAWTANAGSPPGPAQDRVYGGGFVPAGSCTDGPDTFCTLGDREFSIVAVSSPEGGGAYGTIRFSTVAVRVTCLAVSGNAAEMGGVVTDSPSPSNIGLAFRLFVTDTGSPLAARDGVSPNFFDTGTPSGPATCGDLATRAFDSGYFALARGDLVVEDR